MRPLDLGRPVVFVPLFVALFSITYFEPFAIAGVKFSVLWRAMLVLPSVAVIVMRPWSPSAVPREMAPLAWAWGAYTIAPLLSVAFGTTVGSAAIEMFSQRLFPAIAVLLVIAVGAWSAGELVIRAFAPFLALGSLLFFSGLVPPSGLQFSLEHLGISATAYTGVFQNQHSAALAHAIAGLTAFAVVSWYPGRRSWPYLLAGIACLVLTAATTARAGVGAFVIGMVFIAFMRRDWRMLAVPVAGAVVALCLVALIRPELLDIAVERALGRTLYQDRLTADSFTSGRLGLQQAAIDVWARLDLQLKAFGIGAEALARAIGVRTGFTLMAHNVFIDETLNHGLFGIAALLGSLATASHLGWKNARTGHPLGLALVGLVAVFGLFQSLNYSLQLACVGLVLALETYARLARHPKH